jgi:hypothetical protein
MRHILEFINMCYGILEVIKLDDIWFIQIFIIGRPLRAIFGFKGIGKLLNCIKQAIWNVIYTIIFIMFFMLIFSIIGNTIYGTIYYNRCRLDPVYDSNLDRWVGKIDPSTNLCQVQYQDTESSSEIKDSILTRNLFVNSNFSIDNYFNTEINCNLPYTCYNILDPPKKFNLTHFNFSYLDDNLNSEIDLYHGIRNFDTILYAFLSVFTVMTFQSWSQLVSTFDDSVDPTLNRIFFVPLLIFLGFFLMKFILAAENNALMKTFKKEKEVILQDSSVEIDQKNLNQKSTMDQQPNQNLSDDEENKNNQVDQSSEVSSVKSENSSKFSIESSNEMEDGSNTKKIVNFNKNNFHEHVNIVSVLMRKKTLTDNKKLESKENSLQTHTPLKSFRKSKIEINQLNQTSPKKFSRPNSKKSTLTQNKTFPFKILHKLPKPILKNKIRRLSIVKENTNENRNNVIVVEIEKLATKVKEQMSVLVSTQYSNHIINFLYNTIIYLSILTNTIVVSFNSYPSPLMESQKVARINFGFNIVMLVDVVIKFCVLGFKKFFTSKENIIMVVLVTFSLIEYFLGSGNVSGISTMQLIRLLLILQVGKVDLTLRKLISFWVNGYKDVFYYFVLLFLVFSIFLITGRVLFYNITSQSHEIRDEYGYWDKETLLFRENFNSFSNGLMTVIIVFLGDVSKNNYKYMISLFMI